MHRRQLAFVPLAWLIYVISPLGFVIYCLAFVSSLSGLWQGLGLRDETWRRYAYVPRRSLWVWSAVHVLVICIST
jgi:hypothetical protein